MSRRRARPLPSYTVAGWVIDKCPNTFAEQYAWTATALDAEGYQVQRLGFATKRDAVAHAKANERETV